MKLKLLSITLAIIVFPLIAMEPQRPMSLEEKRALMTAERQRLGRYEQPTSYLGYLPVELSTEIAEYIADQSVDRTDQQNYKIRLQNRSLVYPILLARIAAGSGNPTTTIVIRDFTQFGDMQTQSTKIQWPLRFRINDQRDTTLLRQQFYKNQALPRFSSNWQMIGVNAPVSLHFIVVDDPAYPGAIKLVNENEAGQGYIRD